MRTPQLMQTVLVVILMLCGYLYLLQIISRVRDYPWHYLVKAWSVAFEVLLCTAVVKLAF